MNAEQHLYSLISRGLLYMESVLPGWDFPLTVFDLEMYENIGVHANIRPATAADVPYLLERGNWLRLIEENGAM